MNPLKKIVVTGCNKGIGAKIVENLASKQHNHLIMACRNVSAAQKTSNNFENKNPQSKIDFCQIDLQNGASIQAFTENIKKKYDKIDVLINNAGITCPMTSKSEQDTRKVLETNFYSTVQLTEQLLDNINQSGKIIFAGGFVGKFNQLSNQKLKGKLKGCQTKNDLFELVKQYENNFKEGSHIKNGWPKWSYALSKLAINIYAKILSKHPTVTSNRIQVYSYCPGYVKTDMTGNKGKLTPAEGATTPVFLAQLDPSQSKPEQNGGFFQKCKLSSLD